MTERNERGETRTRGGGQDGEERERRDKNMRIQGASKNVYIRKRNKNKRRQGEGRTKEGQTERVKNGRGEKRTQGQARMER